MFLTPACLDSFAGQCQCFHFHWCARGRIVRKGRRFCPPVTGVFLQDGGNEIFRRGGRYILMYLTGIIINYSKNGASWGQYSFFCRGKRLHNDVFNHIGEGILFFFVVLWKCFIASVFLEKKWHFCLKAWECARSEGSPKVNFPWDSTGGDFWRTCLFFSFFSSYRRNLLWHCILQTYNSLIIIYKSFCTKCRQLYLYNLSFFMSIILEYRWTFLYEINTKYIW